LEALRETGVTVPELVVPPARAGVRTIGEPPPEPGVAAVPKPPPEPTGGPIASENVSTTEVYGPLRPQPVQGAGEVPTEVRREGVQPRPETQAGQVLLDPVGNPAEFYSLPRLRTLDARNDPRIAAAKRYYGARTIPDLARLAKARFEQLRERQPLTAKPPEGSELQIGPEPAKPLTAAERELALEQEKVALHAKIQRGEPVTLAELDKHFPEGSMWRKQAIDKGLVPAAPKPIPEPTVAAPSLRQPTAAAPETAGPAAKEPWKMTLEEFTEEVMRQQSIARAAEKIRPISDQPKAAQEYLQSIGQPSEYQHMTADQVRRYSELLGYSKSEIEQFMHLKEMKRGMGSDPSNWYGAHELHVKEAILEGKPVPPEVMADYPDLKAKPPAEAPKAAPAAPAPTRESVLFARNAPTQQVMEKVRTDFGLTIDQLDQAHRLYQKGRDEPTHAISLEWFVRDLAAGKREAIDAVKQIQTAPAPEPAKPPEPAGPVAPTPPAKPAAETKVEANRKLRMEGVTEENAKALIAGTKTPKEVVDSQLGQFDPGPERHREARLLAKTTAINKINEILDKPERYTAEELYGKPAREKELAEIEKTAAPKLVELATANTVQDLVKDYRNRQTQAALKLMDSVKRGPNEGLVDFHKRLVRMLPATTADLRFVESISAAADRLAKGIGLEEPLKADASSWERHKDRKNRNIIAGLKSWATGEAESLKARLAEQRPSEPPAGEIPPGPGAASPSEFAERTARGAGAMPPPGNPPAAIDGGTQPTPEIARSAKDFNIFNNINSGQWAFYFGKLGPSAKGAWDKMALAAFKIRESIGRDVQRYADNLLAKLPRPIRAKGGKVFFEALDGKPMDQIEAEWAGRPHGDAVIAAAGEIKTRLEEIRVTIRDAKREAYNAFLMGLDRDTLATLFDNNISRAVDTSKYTKDQFADALTRAELPDDWGIADGSYLPHLFTGNWKVTAKLGDNAEFVTRSKTVAEAKIRVSEYIKNNPDYANAEWKIEQDTVIPADMIRLGDRRFWNLVRQMKDSLGVTASEVKQAQQGIIGRKSSKQKWFGNLQQRRGFTGYSHDYKQTITAYLSGFHRWLELSKLQREVQPLIEQVRREGRISAADELDILMENLWGKPARSTVQFDNFVREIPGLQDYIKPMALDRWSRNIKSTVAFLTLKTARFAVVNRLQPLGGLYPLVGERIFSQAKIRRYTAEGRALLDEAGVRFDPGQYANVGGVASKLKSFSEWVSGERGNQEIAFLAMFQHGTESGLSRSAAIDYAKLRGQLLTQFTPIIPDIPPIMRGPFTSLMFQFTRFPIKQIELLFKMTAQRQFGGLARWIGVMAATGGLTYYMRQFFLPSDKRERLRRGITQEYGKTVADAVMYGLPGLVNVDLSGSLVLGDEPFGANIYEKAGRKITGPGVGLTVDALRTVLTSPRAPTTTAQDAITLLRRFPTLKPIAELIALEQSDLDVRTPDGEVKYRKAVKDAIVGLGAFRSANESNTQSAINAVVELKKQESNLKNAAFVEVMKTDGNIQGALDEIQKFNERWPEVAISSKELGEYIKDRTKGMSKTDYERLVGKKFAPLLPSNP